MFALFNLQGTFGFFDRFSLLLHRPLGLSAELTYPTTVSTFCQEVFSTSFCVPLRHRRCFSSSLHIISGFSSLVNLFFRFFFPFFSPYHTLYLFPFSPTTLCAIAGAICLQFRMPPSQCRIPGAGTVFRRPCRPRIKRRRLRCGSLR